MNLQGISFVVTYGCNARCDHCFYPTPLHSGSLSTETLRRAMTKELNWIHFTGGEPTLNPDHLTDLIRAARDTGHEGNIGLATNGWWASDPDAARRRVNEWRDAGLTGLSVSVDVHRRTVEPSDGVG